jgi:hypothetical protein
MLLQLHHYKRKGILQKKYLHKEKLYVIDFLLNKH